MKLLDTIQQLYSSFRIEMVLKVFVMFMVLLTATPQVVCSAEFNVDSTTMLRTRQTTDDKNLFPAYEYLSLSANDFFDPRLSFYAGAWGKLELSNEDSEDETEGELQYAYINFRSESNNLVANMGRQFVVDGGISEHIDGVYLRTDLPVGFGISTFIGKPVIEDTKDYEEDFTYGGRISHSSLGFYTVGLSYLSTENDGDRSREEESFDIWFHPMTLIDITGQSSYNSVTEGWMEHDYTLSLMPSEKLSFDVNFSQVNYGDYFYHMSTNVFSLITLSNPTGSIDSAEEMKNVGGSIAYSPVDWVTFSGDYKNFDYKIAGSADLYGGSLTLTPSSFPDFISGTSVHRMKGDSDELRYWAYRLFASYKIKDFKTSLDLLDLVFDQRISGVKNSFVAVASGSYEMNDRTEIGGSLDYSQSPEFEYEVRGMLSLTCLFGRAK